MRKANGFKLEKLPNDFGMVCSIHNAIRRNEMDTVSTLEEIIGALKYFTKKSTECATLPLRAFETGFADLYSRKNPDLGCDNLHLTFHGKYIIAREQKSRWT